MPIEVRELIIKAVVNSKEKPTSGKKTDEKPASKKNVAEGLDKALELIKNRNER